MTSSSVDLSAWDQGLALGRVAAQCEPGLELIDRLRAVPVKKPDGVSPIAGSFTTDFLCGSSASR
jgi:hypothetical protein